MNATHVLVMSQVFLSFGIALALIPLLRFTGDRQLMGDLTNKPLTQAAGRLIAVVVITINLYLLVTTFTGFSGF